MTYIPKKVLIERLDPKTPHAETIRKVIDSAYAVAEAAHRERDELRTALDPKLGAKMRDLVKDRYVPRLAEIAQPLDALRGKVEDERRASRGMGLSPAIAALNAGLALADGALWSTRRELAPMAGVRTEDIELMGVGL